nr:hypothetical protein [uncultured Moellerella sp.]
MKKILILIIATVYSSLLFADNDWYVSIPKSRLDPTAPFNKRFQYTSVVYFTEQGLKSTLPVNYASCATNGCYVGVNTQNTNNPNDPRYLDPEQENVFFIGSTVGDALTALNKRLGSMTYMSDATAPDRTQDVPPITWCGAVGISTSGSGASYRVLNGGVCGVLPPPNLECALLTPDVLIDHKILSIPELKENPDTQEGVFTIKCNREANIKLAIISPDEKDSNEQEGTRIVFKENGGLVSYLKINGKVALSPTTFQIKNLEGEDFIVTSKLKIEEGKVVPGPFYSFAYIVLSFD